MPLKPETTSTKETRTPALAHKSNKGSKKTLCIKTQTFARESMTFALLQKPAEFAKITAASEEICAKKSTESALKLQSASTMYAAETSATLPSTLEMDVEDAVAAEAAEVSEDVELVLADQSCYINNK
jgi:hypothetical protein